MKALTLRQIGELWIGRNGQLDPATLTGAGSIIRNLDEFFGPASPSALRIGRWEKYVAARLKDTYSPRIGRRAGRKISPRTVHNEVSFGVRLLKWAWDRRDETGMTELPVTAPPVVTGKDRTRGRKMTVPEFWRVYEAAGSRPAWLTLQRILGFAFATMLRRTPLLAIEGWWIEGYENDEDVLRVPAAFMKKGRSRERHDFELPLNRFAQEMAGLPDRLPESGPLWRIGSNVHRTLVTLAKVAEVEPFSLHDIRRTGASALVNHRCPAHPTGAPKMVVDRILGHAQPMNDAAYYQVGMDAIRDALSIIDEEFAEHQQRGEGTNVVPFRRRA